MNEFVIVSDSTVDLPKKYLQEKQIPIISLSYVMEGVTYEEMNGLSHKEFFEKLKEGSLPTTSQINPEQARKALEPFAKEGKDILYIGFSSGLSGSYNSVRMAAMELTEEYPNVEIITIDSLCACMGEGLLLYKALELKEQGMAMKEIADWVEHNKLHVCHNVTVDDLNHLHRGGRISKTTAVVGSMIKIKPIIHMSDEGKLVVIGKERGRKKSLISIVNRMEKQMQGYENDIVMITHGDCIEDAEFVKKQIEERFGIHNVMINGIGSVIGSHTGAGVVAVFFMGDKR